MSDALNTVSQALNLKSRIMYLKKQEADIEAAKAEQESPLYKQEKINELTGAYIENYNNVAKVAETLGETPEVIQARNNAKLQLRSSLSLPLGIAAAGQHMHKQGAGEIAANSTETAQMVLDAEGYDKDTQDRIAKMMLKSGAAAQGVNLPEMGLADQSMNVVSGIYNMPKAEVSTIFNEASIQPTANTEGLLGRVITEATETFNKMTSNSGISPEERITWAVESAMLNQNVGEAVEVSEALYIANTTMEGLERRQSVRVQRAMSQLPALNRKYEEDAAVVLYDFMQQAHQAGKAITYDNIMQSVGENEMLAGFRNPDGLGDTYQKVKKNIALLNQNYEKLPERDRFSLFVGAFADFAAHNVNSGSPIRDQYQLGGLERLRSAAETGQLYAKFDGLVAPLEELWADFESQHNEKVVARNEVIARNTNAGLVSATAPDGKVASWKDIQDPLRNERVSKLVTDPAVFDLLHDMNKVRPDKDGNYTLNIGNMDMMALQTYANAMNVGGDWGELVIQDATPTMNAVKVVDTFSQEGMKGWGEFLGGAQAMIHGNKKYFAPRTKDGAVVEVLTDRLAKLEYKKIPVGKVIANSAELKMALQNSTDDPSQIEAVFNAAMVMHFNTVDETVLRVAAQAESDMVQDFVSVLPTEVQANARRELTTGSISAVQQKLPQYKTAYIEATAERDEFKERYPRFNKATAFGAKILSAAPGAETPPEAQAALAEWNRISIKVAKAERDLKRISNKMNNYVNEVDKRKELTALQDAFGATPPRSWAFIQNVGELVDDIDWTLNTYK